MIEWTKDETETLYKNFDGMTLKEITKLLPVRTYNAVSKKARKMGLAKHNGEVRREHSYGYIIVRCDEYPIDLPGYFVRPSTETKAKYIYEHYLVWWKNRPNDVMQKWEMLHHIDGNPANNDILNLQRIKKKDHLTNGVAVHAVQYSADFEDIEARRMSTAEYLTGLPDSISGEQI